MSLYVSFAYRNESYVACIQLAILDHNFHNQREKWMNKKGEVMYQRKYRKQSKKWDVTLLLAPKKYNYIPDLFIHNNRKRYFIQKFTA